MLELSRGLPGVEKALCEARDDEANNNCYDAVSKLSDNGNSGRRKLNRMLDIQICKGYGVSYPNVGEIHRILQGGIFKD